jgi:hypothetical protein
MRMGRALPRLALGAAGVAGLIVGGIIAWRNGDSGVVLIIAAILIVLAVIAPDWQEIHAAGAGYEVRVLRQVQEALHVASTTDDDSELRAKVAQLELELASLAERQGAASGLFGRTRRDQRDTPNVAMASHVVLEDRAVLALTTTSPTSQVECTVKRPDGSTAAASAGGAALLALAAGFITLSYPDDFPEAAELVPGTYDVAWRKPDGSGNGAVIAPDSFLYPP